MTSVHENLTRAEARARAEVIDDVAYTVHLDLTRGDKEFGSETTIRFSATPGSATHVDLTAATVHSVELNGTLVADAAVSDTRIAIEDLQATNELRVVATMAYTHEGRGMHFFRDPADERVYLHSQGEPFDAHLIFPCFDQPDLKGTFSFSVEAPANWVVVSNDICIERPSDGRAGTWRFASTPVLSPYLAAIVAGEYTVFEADHNGLPMAWYARQSMAEFVDTEELFDLTRAGLDWFGDAFAFPYPFSKYDQLFVPEFAAGAMENPGCITFNETYLFRSKVTDAARHRRAETLLHEMAHMWFGDLVTMRWFDDLWLNESFATFMSVLALSEATRFEDAWVSFLDNDKAWAKYQDQLPTTHPIVADLYDVEQVHQNFDGITYAKGASVLRQLVAWVGEEAFLKGCRHYFAQYAWGNAELTQFLASLEEASGRDLHSWASQWLETTGLNTLEAEATVDDGRFTAFRIRQFADDLHPTLRDHRVAVGVYADQDGSLVRTRREELDVAGPTTEVAALVGADAGAFVLVNDDDLTFAKVRLDERSFNVLVDRLRDVAEPLARAQVWGATWDMVRDSALEARRWARMMMNNAADESSIGVLQGLQTRCLAAAERYGDPANRDHLLREMATNAWQEVLATEPGSDRQLAWVRHWAACVREQDASNDLIRLLEGDVVLESLELDTDLRWHLVTCLARAGSASDELIDAELERDRTDVGERNAMAARAARPDAKDKQAAWDLLTSDELSHTVTRTVAMSWNRMDQAELLAPFADQYLDAVDAAWEARSVSAAIDLAGWLFPHPAASEDLLQRLRNHLDGDVPAPLRRVLLEQTDILERTLRARALDAQSAD
ncbi:MAG: aminopeptidase N [Nitriliruptorales bacterium]|nr:aminopeptidase N [Nitriliruptorales bacterium]